MTWHAVLELEVRQPVTRSKSSSHAHMYGKLTQLVINIHRLFICIHHACMSSRVAPVDLDHKQHDSHLTRWQVLIPQISNQAEDTWLRAYWWRLNILIGLIGLDSRLYSLWSSIQNLSKIRSQVFTERKMAKLNTQGWMHTNTRNQWLKAENYCVHRLEEIDLGWLLTSTH